MATEYPWPTRPLGNAGTWLSGGTPSKDNSAFWSGTVPWVSPKDMKAARIGDAIDHVSNAAVGNGTRLVPSDTLLMVVRGMILAHTFPVALTTSEVAFNQDIKALQAARDFLPDFLLYWLQSRAAEILKLTDVANHGTRRLPTERLFALETPVPPLPEQRKIAAILSAVDEVIEKTEAVIESLQALKKAMMQELLTRGLPGRHTRFKQTEIGEVPEGWEVVELGQVATVGNGSTPSRANDDYWIGGSIPWLPTGKVNDVVVQEADEFVTEKALAECPIRLLPAGTILVAMIGQGKTRGKVAYLALPACINQNFAYISPNKHLRSWFCFYYLHWKYETLRASGRGSNQDALNCAIIRKFHLPLPPVHEQDAISNALASLHDAELKEYAVVGSLTVAKSALMSVLLSGELRVTPDQDVA